MNKELRISCDIDDTIVDWISAHCKKFKINSLNEFSDIFNFAHSQTTASSHHKSATRQRPPRHTFASPMLSWHR